MSDAYGPDAHLTLLIVILGAISFSLCQRVLIILLSNRDSQGAHEIDRSEDVSGFGEKFHTVS
jgi:hypothetical protein